MRAYGCVKCQRHHAERDGSIYHEHISFQSKHGIYRLTERDWVIAKLHVAEPKS